jgi:hypothetical protein
MADVSSSMLEFLRWVADRRRTYDEAAEAWRSTCPRHTIWEDAFIEGFVRVTADRPGSCEVVLTAAGQIALQQGQSPAEEMRATAA